jgi:hypothetical protein
MHPCCWPECVAEGTFPAPKNPRDLRQRQYFCALHIKEFNKRWNGLNGFSEAEIYTMQEPTATWQRPSWASKTEAKGPKDFKNANDLYGFFNSRLARELNGEAPVRHKALPKDVAAACKLFGLEAPLAESQMKRRYLNLVKQNHPDINPSPEAAEAIKKINVAYKILCDYSTRNGLNA